MNNNDNAKASNKWRIIIYWVTTSLVIFELLYGATWDFNLLNKGFAQTVMAHLGYPSYLLVILGISKILAAICLALPGLPLIKEWAYTGLMILFCGAACVHIITGYDITTIIFLSICIILTIISYVFRPITRRIAI